LIILQAQYRDIHAPVIRLAAQLRAQHGEGRIAGLIPEIIKQRWYQYLLHTSRARKLRARLLRDAGPWLTIIIVPWRLDPAEAPDDTAATSSRQVG